MINSGGRRDPRRGGRAGDPVDTHLMTGQRPLRSNLTRSAIRRQSAARITVPVTATAGAFVFAAESPVGATQ